ncbi:MAG: signal peptidase I [Actinomycetaceae bacterium]|nr:signal peptidase I [Actinomycetaceae bacterium]
MMESREYGTPEEMPPSFPPERLDNDEKTTPEATGPAPDPEDVADDEQLEEQEEKTSRLRSLVETVAIIASALLVSVFIKTFLLQAFYVPSGSMESTLVPGDRIAVNRLVDSADEIHRGDVVVFVDPGGWLDNVSDNRPLWRRTISDSLQAVGLLPEDAGKHLVKRVIGVGGDTVACCSVNGNLTVNGVEINEPYVREGANPSDLEFSVQVPRNKLWVMGDNRDNSRDSRYHMNESDGGFVPVDNVVGRAWGVFYPFSRFGSIPSASNVFDDVE